MKRIILSFTLLGSALLLAQKSPNVKFAISNNDVIGTVTMFSKYSALVKSTIGFKKGATLPADLQKYSFLADNGLSLVNLKPKSGTPDIFSLQTMNKQYSLPETTSVIIDGYEVASNFKIYTDIIDKVEKKDQNGVQTLFITTLK